MKISKSESKNVQLEGFFLEFKDWFLIFKFILSKIIKMRPKFTEH